MFQSWVLTAYLFYYLKFRGFWRFIIKRPSSGPWGYYSISSRPSRIGSENHYVNHVYSFYHPPQTSGYADNERGFFSVREDTATFNLLSNFEVNLFLFFHVLEEWGFCPNYSPSLVRWFWSHLFNLKKFWTTYNSIFNWLVGETINFPLRVRRKIISDS